MQQPIPMNAKLEHPDWFTWVASVLEGDDGKFHMVYCRWLKKYPFGNGWLIDSELCYAVSDHSSGPFKHVTTLKAHLSAEDNCRTCLSHFLRVSASPCYLQ